MSKTKAKEPLKAKVSAGNSNPIKDLFDQFLQMIPDNKEFLLKFLDVFPFPLEVFAPNGVDIFCNQAFWKLINAPDASFVTGKYNLLNDPVINDQMGMKDCIQKAFRGETVIAYDVDAPIHDVVDRGAAEEKPFEKSFMDFHLYPIKKNNELLFVVFVCNVKKLYHGRPDLARAKVYMDTHWRSEYDAEAVAKSVNMSVTQLYRLFREHTGMTPGDYHKKAKVEHIKEKLADRNLSVKEAFAACGEDSRGWMLQVFKETTGMTPTKFRKR